jgi:F420-non-reducing hydrogenase iron-sulfur subunit
MSKEIVAYCCEHSAYTAADIAGREGLRYPEELRVIRVPCAGRVDVLHVLKAFENGAGAVMVLGCEDGACHHIDGNKRARQRVEYAKALLEEVGINGQSVAMFNLAPNAPHKFVQIANDVSNQIKGVRG